MKKIIVLLVASLMTQNVLATVTYCVGDISKLGVRTNGEVYVVLNETGSSNVIDYVNMCSLSATLYGVTKEICQIWYNKFNTSYLTGKDVVLYFDSAVTDCDMGPGGAPDQDPAGIEAY